MLFLQYRTKYTLMKKWLRTFLTICIPLLLLYSCEGYRCAEGVVRDKITFAPIDSAKINVLTSEDKVKYTDTTGVFNVCNYMGGCVPRCKEITDLQTGL